MSSLRDQIHSTDPARARAARLLRTPLIDESAERQARVRLALRRRRARKPSWILRPAVAVLLLVSVLVTAGATVGKSGIGSAWRQLERGVTRVVHRVWRKDSRLQEPAPPSANASNSPPAPSPVKAIAPPPTLAPVHEVKKQPARSSPLAVRGPVVHVSREDNSDDAGLAEIANAIATAPPDEARPLYRALRELRVVRNPANAAQMLDDYLSQFGRGSLAEPALALAIEAHVTLGDRRAIELSHRYLSLYPDGRYRSVARGAEQFLDSSREGSRPSYP